MKPNSLVKLAAKDLVKIQELKEFAAVPKNLKASGLVFPKDFKAAVMLDKKGSPKYFVFDTYSLWDLLCAADAGLEESVSDEAYVHKNPVGWLIDAIEKHLPLNPKLITRLKKGIEEARQTGLIPLEKAVKKLGLS